MKTTIVILLGFSLAGFFSNAILGSRTIDKPVPVGKFLNGSLPALSSSGEVAIAVAFPQLSFIDPIVFTPHPNQHLLFVGQRDGQVFYFENDDSIQQKEAFLDLREQVGIVEDAGFLGLAFHPDFGKPTKAGRNYFYTYYSTRDSNGGHQPQVPIPPKCEPRIWFGGYLVLSRWEVEEGSLVVKAESELIMIKLRLYNSTHRGGGLFFGNDGFLYLSTGDQGQYQTAQIMNNNLEGGVLRIDVDMDSTRSHEPLWKMPQDPRGDDEISGVGYFIPNQNPFVDLAEQVFTEYYAIGYRNPYRMSQDPLTGNIFLGDVGSWVSEEINLVESGDNAGWPVWEDSTAKNRCMYNLQALAPEHKLPLTSFARSDANAIIGGYVYRGTQVPFLYGKYICADFGIGDEVFTVDPVTGEYQFLLNFSPTNIISFGQDQQGEVYVLHEGNNVKLYRFKVSGNVQAPPAKLSEIDAFEDLPNLEPAKALIPYEMNVPFWSDGAQKFRWMVIPNDGVHDSPEEKIVFSETEPWQFPIGSVLIKHFELGGKRLETRFLVHGEDSIWYGLTYKWRPDNSEADLLENSLDESVVVDGEAQIWHYPSQSECLSCHTKGAGNVLGPSTRQLNRNIRYPGSTLAINQLVQLNYLQMFSPSLKEEDIPHFLTSTPSSQVGAPLEDRARAYLDANCAYCHQPETGNRAGFDLRLSVSLADQGLLDGELIDNLGIDNAKALVMKEPDLSMIFHRIKELETGIAMPPLAKSKVDEAGVELIRQWIKFQETPSEIPAIKVYPNPNAKQEPIWVEFISLKDKEAQIKIRDLQGHFIFQTHYTSTDLVDRVDLDIGQYAAGVYLLEVLVAGQRVCQKIILQ